MNRTYVLCVMLMVVFVLSSFSMAAPTGEEESAKESTNDEEAELVVVVHYVKPEKPTKPEKPAPTEPELYELMGIKWKDLPIELKVNPTGSGMAAGTVLQEISESGEEWDAYTSTEIFYDYVLDYSATFDYTVRDGTNELVFGDFDEANVIAVTYTWGIFGGPPKNRKIVEFDIMFDTDFIWGDATETGGVMDLQNIATHEIGHGIGLLDLYDSEAIEQTMYGYASYDEIIKRDLNTGDIAGLQELYGE